MRRTAISTVPLEVGGRWFCSASARVISMLGAVAGAAVLFFDRRAS